MSTLFLNVTNAIHNISYLFSDNYTEELLTVHEKEVASVKEYYENHKQILELVAKREVLFHKMIEFEVSFDKNPG